MKRFVVVFGFFAVCGFVMNGDAAFAKKVYIAPVDKPFNLMDSFTELNRLKPLQNPKYKKSEAVLGRTVTDRQNKIVGSVENMIVAPDGKTTSLEVLFDRLRLEQPVFLSYESTKISATSNGYKIGFEGDQIEAMYPELMAGIETAAGSSEIVSIKDVIGKSIVDPSNAVVGTITDILFDDKISKAEAFFVTLDSGSARSAGVAVPFRVVTFEDNGGILRGRMSQSDIATMKTFSRD